MDRLVHRLRSFNLVLVALGLLGAAQCAARETVIRIGLPNSHQQEAQQLASKPRRCEDQEPTCIRYRYALGSDYQVLDWLQNGKIDGAVVSGMTLELVRRTVGKAFDKEFLVTARLPHTDLALRRYEVLLSAERKSEPGREAGTAPDPEAHLSQLFRDLAGGSKREDTVVDIPSHLSAGVPELFRRLRAWIDAHPEFRTDAPRALGVVMTGLVARLRFGADGADGPPLRLVLTEDVQPGGPLGDVFLVRRVVLPQQSSDGAGPPPSFDAERDFLEYLNKSAKSGPPEHELVRFATGNYVSESVGSRSRFRFAYTLDELRNILRRHAGSDPAEDDGIALVLTGGGVKAAYQTKLIDHLYGSGFLRNLFAESGSNPAAVPVKYVVGTSGGALLGIFVASLDGVAPDLDLSTRLWHRHDQGRAGEALSSGDVFPAVDLMRWLSLVWCLVIFVVICGATSWYLRHMRGHAPQSARDRGARLWRISLWWIALLTATPWLLMYMNRGHGAEHIPAIQGAFYFLFLAIAIYSDNRLVVRQAARAGKSAWPPAAVGALGIALVVAALLLSFSEPQILSVGRDFSITASALIGCFGVAIVFLGLHWWFARCAPRLEPIPRDALPSFLLLAGVCALSYLLLYAATRVGIGSMFELTLEFWITLGAMALIASVAFVYLAYGKGMPALRRRFDFLLAPHPARCAERLHGIGTARYSRMILFFVTGWAWWNLIVAPGLYGNDNARAYFEAAARNVFGKAAVGEHSTLDVTFRAFYAAPVTALEQGIERYIVFQPPQPGAPGPGPGGPESGSQRSLLSISKDPRWLVIDSAKAQRDLVMRVAFASGSPFPVFPAHRINLPGNIGEELLVDGGYAHNVPVEAGKRLGARRVLVIDSSPREPAARQPEGDEPFQYVGKLTWMLRWIIPYLYKRSQVEDALSAEDLIVALIAPSASPQDWPFLTDFRAEVIKRMFEQSEKDRAQRVGTIENWGRPAFVRRSFGAPQ